MPQFKYDESDHRFYVITYQSNEIINDELHSQTKKRIAQILIKKLDVKVISSYIHGDITLGVSTNKPIAVLKQIVDLLHKPLVEGTPKLLFSVNLIATSNDSNQWLYIEGDKSMNENFLESISDIFPIKEK